MTNRELLKQCSQVIENALLPKLTNPQGVLDVENLLRQINAELSKPKPSPVAYLSMDKDSAAIFIPEMEGKPVEVQNYMAHWVAWWTPLYAELKWRTPLSNDEIKAIMLANGFEIKPGLDDLKPYVYEAARAIEAAHGIYWSNNK